MDFIERMPTSHGKDTILLVADQLTKYANFIELKHPFIAHTFALEFTKEIVRLHGFPTSTISYHDKVFLSLFWKEHFCLQGTDLKYSSAYHPKAMDSQRRLTRPLRRTCTTSWMGDQRIGCNGYLGWNTATIRPLIHPPKSHLFLHYMEEFPLTWVGLLKRVPR